MSLQPGLTVFESMMITLSLSRCELPPELAGGTEAEVTVDVEDEAPEAPVAAAAAEVPKVVEVTWIIMGWMTSHNPFSRKICSSRNAHTM